MEHKTLSIKAENIINETYSTHECEFALNFQTCRGVSEDQKN